VLGEHRRQLGLGRLHLRQVIGWRGIAQRDPLNEYKSEAFDLFNGLVGSISFSPVAGSRCWANIGGSSGWAGSWNMISTRMS
jgi:hypothetical protein